jgi:regulator of cell morphogenesis and NO signaling
MSIDTGRPLAEIVNRSRGSARVLESFGLDYCCGGSRSLIDACAVVGADPSEVLDALDRLGAEPQPAWISMGVAELVDHIERTHHAYLHDELPRLVALAQKVSAVHGGSHPELMDLLADIAELRDDLEPHLAKEEAVLFPILRQLDEAGPTAAALAPSRPIAVMIAEHEVTGALLERIRARTDGFTVPPDACTSYRQLYLGLADLEADTHLHVHKENNVLFPAVLGESGGRP